MPIDTSIYRQQPQQPSPMESMGHLLGLKAAIQQQQAGALQLEQQKRAVSDDAAARQLFAGGADVTDDQILSTLGPVHGGAILKVRREQQRAELDRSISELTLKGTRAKLGGQILAGVRDQASYQAALPVIAQILGPDAAKHFGPQYDPAMVQQFVNSGLSTEAQLEEKRKQVEDARKATEFGWKTAAQPLQQKKLENEVATGTPNAAGLTRNQQVLADTRAKDKTDWEIAYDQTDPKLSPAERAAEARKIHEASRIRVAQASRPQVNITGPGALTDDDLKREGEQYARTGIMPTLGMGSSDTRSKIMHYKNEWARTSGLSTRELLTAQAAYKGDTASLNNFQKQADQIKSFEQTAQKNIDLFISAAEKIPDTGVPWLNMPVRMLNEKLVGSANMAAVNAARQVANNEIAKVTSGGGLGSVLSDSARHEVEAYNPKDATLKQTLRVAKVLKQDMANRISSMDTTLGEIKARIGGGQPGAAPPAAVKVKVWNDKTQRFE